MRIGKLSEHRFDDDSVELFEVILTDRGREWKRAHTCNILLAMTVAAQPKS